MVSCEKTDYRPFPLIQRQGVVFHDQSMAALMMRLWTLAPADIMEECGCCKKKPCIITESMERAKPIEEEEGILHHLFIMLSINAQGMGIASDHRDSFQYVWIRAIHMGILFRDRLKYLPRG